MFEDDIQFLVTETFQEVAKNLIGHDQEFQLQNDAPEAAGIFYQILKGQGSFVLKTQQSSNLNKEYNKIANENLDENLKIYFYSPSPINVSSYVCDQVSKKRFPVEDSSVFTLSDPGVNWWLITSEQSIEISFKFKSLSKTDAHINIGPLGDACIARLFFEKMIKALKAKIELKNCGSQSDKIFFQFEENELSRRFLNSLRCLFLLGDVHKELLSLIHESSVISQTEKETLEIYLFELANVRKFWLQVNQNINESLV